jgi:hypothetical protein
MEIAMRRMTCVFAAALMLLGIACGGCAAATVDGYQAGLSREAYTAGVDALATARQSGQINDGLALDVEAARLIVVTAIDVQDPEHQVVNEPASTALAVRATPGNSALGYVRNVISAMRATSTLTHGITATAKATGRPLNDSDFAEIMRRQSLAEQRWLALLPTMQ